MTYLYRFSASPLLCIKLSQLAFLAAGFRRFCRFCFVRTTRKRVCSQQLRLLSWRRLVMVHEWLSTYSSWWFGLKGGGFKKESVAAFRDTPCFCWIIRLVVRVCCARKSRYACCALLLQGQLVRESVRVGGQFIYHDWKDGFGVVQIHRSSKIMDVLHNRSSRLEMVMYLLSVVAANGGCGCYRVGGARGAQTRWLTIPRSSIQLDLSCFLLDLARNGRGAFCQSITGCKYGVLYPCWRSNLSLSRSLTLYILGEVSKSSSVFDVGQFGSKEILCLLLSQGVVGSWVHFVLTVGPYTAH